MVQRKAPSKIGPQSSSHQQEDTRTKGGGGGDLKKKMKLERSMRAADLESLQGPPMKNKPEKRSPNYMKPTSSWDARKEPLQVTPPTQSSTDKKRRPPNPENSNSLKPSSPSSCPFSGLKLSKSPSLKAVRPLIKKSLVINRATCSSTLKESKFPEGLDLTPGGTSVMRVCPYTYCSLNGHRHEALPPLKCFMSARRKLLKTQKSMKLKGVSPLRPKGLGKDEEIDTGQKAASKVPSSFEESDDFFVEIYTASSPEEHLVDQKSPEEVLKEDVIVKYGLDQNSEISNEEVDAMMSFIEYVECDQQADGAEEAQTPSIAEEVNEGLQVDCHPVSLSEEANEGEVEIENKASIFNFNWEEEEGSQCPDDMTECSECLDGCSGLVPTELSTEKIALVNACDVAQTDEEAQQEVNQEPANDGSDKSKCDELLAITEADVEFKQEVDQKVDTEIIDTMAPDGGNLEGINSKSHEGKEFRRTDVLETSKPNDPDSSENGDNTCCHCDSKENDSDVSFQGSEEVVSEVAGQGHEDAKEQENDNEVKETDSLSIVQLFDSSDNLKESGQCITEVDQMQNFAAICFECDDATEAADTSSDTQSCSSGGHSDDSDIEEYWESENEQQAEVSPIEGSMAKSNARIRIRRKKIAEEPDEMREFNPRPPRFLDVEPNPDAEKVDLRHQEMDERKNSEEYLLDHALQRAVTKLAPARKRKVALLVEAFETVMPLPVCEKPSQNSASGFINARFMQACS